MNAVEVWWARVDQAQAEFLNDLNAIEQERYARYRRDDDKARFLLGVTLVRRLVGERMSVPPASVVLDRSCRDCGKPHGKVRTAGVELSVSHSGEWVGLAIGTAPVGLDVERIDSRTDVDGVADMTLAPEELQELKRYDGIAKARAFTRYWTRKESLVKATEDGIGAGLCGVVVSSPDQPAAVVRWEGHDGPAQLVDVQTPDDDHLAALAVLSAEPPVVHVDQFRI
ncbi:4'-phosphopantetheinyl transferase superfamily protein [Kribbella antibiotica]|uniref:4'-phosphopantetheinyl transferase superfamily protein n=1 Tax=Kribbella antibiotica TaxID=190195 RepID=A0A4R4ZUP1_9ACTN|nr:4'-phosphopantetheinyl transferase superfamily protein [Kribbella antibiotica]TDD62200.1 4'-phosphopantetheinyl transferase superfamily protein [Kribbella antibiotica]